MPKHDMSFHSVYDTFQNTIAAAHDKDAVSLATHGYLEYSFLGFGVAMGDFAMAPVSLPATLSTSRSGSWFRKLGEWSLLKQDTCKERQGDSSGREERRQCLVMP